VHPVVLMTRTAKCRDRWIGLCGGKRVCSLAHHVDVLGICEEAVAVFSRDFLDNSRAYKMVQRTGNGWNRKLQGFCGCSNANLGTGLYEFMKSQRRGSGPSQFLGKGLVIASDRSSFRMGAKSIWRTQTRSSCRNRPSRKLRFN
jgi:hypothetical protein